MSRPDYDEEKRMVSESASKLPGIFGLRAFPGKRFRVERNASYYHEGRKAIVLYLYVEDTSGVWQAFDKDTVETINREMVKIQVKSNR